MKLTGRGSTVKGHAGNGGQAPNQAKTSGPGRCRQPRNRSNERHAPQGGQYSRESPRAAGTSLAQQPNRATFNTHSVLIRAALPRAAGVREVHPVAQQRSELVVVGQLRTLVPGQGEPDRVGQLAEHGRQRVADGFGRAVDPQPDEFSKE